MSRGRKRGGGKKCWGREVGRWEGRKASKGSRAGTGQKVEERGVHVQPPVCEGSKEILETLFSPAQVRALFSHLLSVADTVRSYPHPTDCRTPPSPPNPPTCKQ